MTDLSDVFRRVGRRLLPAAHSRVRPRQGIVPQSTDTSSETRATGTATVLELVGPPGAGKSILAPIIRHVFVANGGWRDVEGLSMYGGSGSHVRIDDAYFDALLHGLVSRVMGYGIPYPFAYGYIQRCALHIGRARRVAESDCHGDSWFLNESLVHHFAEEILGLWNEGRQLPRYPSLSMRRALIRIVSPIEDVLARLENRRGVRDHYDWASAFGSDVESFVQSRNSAQMQVLERLESSGYACFSIHAADDEDSLAAQCKEIFNLLSGRLSPGDESLD